MFAIFIVNKEKALDLPLFKWRDLLDLLLIILIEIFSVN